VKLFGSYSRGDAREDSDVDVAVLLEGASEADVRRVTELATGVGLEGDGPVVVLAPFVRTPEGFASLLARELRIAQDIERDGIAV
jgi:predicted nucleotidyltransferase